MSRLTRACLAIGGALALAAPAVGASALPAAADTAAGHISIDIGDGWTSDPSHPMFDSSQIVPGWSTTTALGVRNDSSTTSDVVLRSTAIVDDENGCDHAESFVDTTCSGDNAGELGHELVLTLADPSSSAPPIWTGNLYDLEHGLTLSRLTPNAQASYTLTASLPSTSGNETQTDRVGFDLVVGLDGTTGAVEVEGTKITRSPDGGPVQRLLNDLPFTGSPIMRLTAAGLSLLLLGLLLWAAAAQRRVTRTS